MRTKNLVCLARLCITVLAWVLAAQASAQSTVCSVVRIEIQQELTLERQAFDAHMRITNGLEATDLEDIEINVWFLDENDNSVLASSNPDDMDARFFITLDTMSGVTGIDGNGVIGPGAQADIHWLIIPASGAGGQTSTGLLYQVGATLSYTFGGESETVEVAPDFIQVRPMPRLELDYFLPDEVIADDPLTPEEERPIPFELGARVTNSGYGVARHLAIESAQPEIVDNAQGLSLQFELLDTRVNDQQVTNSLLAGFGDLKPGSAAITIWRMTTSLYGHFISFDADYYHSDELGGEMTSLIERVDTHTLVQSVRNDLPGRDAISDFLARDGDVLRLYESDGVDTVVDDMTTESSLEHLDTEIGFQYYALDFPSTIGPVYSSFPDPTDGEGMPVSVWRSDGKSVPRENFWQSRTKESGDWESLVHIFDTSSSGHYELTFEVPNRPPELEPVGDREVTSGDTLEMSFSASDPDDNPLTFRLEPVPDGAIFDDSGDGRALLNWAVDDTDIGIHEMSVSVTDSELGDSENFRVTVLENPIGSILVEADLPLETVNDGGSDSFTVALDKMPEAEVRVPVSSSNEERGTVDVDSLTFTSDDWGSPQAVAVHGAVEESGLFVGDMEYEVHIGPTGSPDENFDGLSHSPLPAVNRDTKHAEVLVSPGTGLATAGDGTSARFELRLNGPPSEPVSITLDSSHPELGLPEPSTVTIDPETWDEPLEVTAQGQPVDQDESGEVLYLVGLVGVDSSDEDFLDARMEPVEVIHRGGDTWGIEAGVVELPAVEGDSGWVEIEFEQPFRARPVVVWLADDGELDPATVRIRGVTTHGFQAVQVEPPAVHGQTEAMTMHFVAVEPGAHPLPGGGVIEAGLMTTDYVQTGAGFKGPPRDSWESIEFTAEFAEPPVFLAGIQSAQNEVGDLPSDASLPWLSVAVEEVKAPGANVALERSSVSSGEVQLPEDVGYLAISGGETSFATNIGWTEWRRQEGLGQAGAWRDGCQPYAWFASAPPGAVLVAHQLTRVNHQGGGWLRLCAVEEGLFGLLFDQDVERTPVRGIHSEDVRALWIGQPFHTRLPGEVKDE